VTHSSANAAGQGNVVGGLRLLFQKWTEQDGILDAQPPIMPFRREDFDHVTDQLCLPKSYPMDFARCQQIPAEVKKISTRYGERLGTTYHGTMLGVTDSFSQRSRVKVQDLKRV
jgi:hypothetical protein